MNIADLNKSNPSLWNRAVTYEGRAGVRVSTRARVRLRLGLRIRLTLQSRFRLRLDTTA